VDAIDQNMDRDWTASFSNRFRNGPCIIILDKKYNIAKSSCHFGSYGSIWTGPSPEKNIIWTSEASVHIKLFWWRTGPYTAIWPSIAMNYLLYSKITVAGRLDGSLETQSRLKKAQQGFDTCKSNNIINTFLSLKW
jgi:hypothetical protein